MKKAIAFGGLYWLAIIFAWGQIPSDGLLAFYPFNGNAWDSSGHQHHGIVHGATPTTDRFGQAGSALYFNNSWVEIPDAPTLRPYNFTYSFWFSVDAQQATNFICKPRGPGQEPTFGIWMRASTIQSYVTRPQQETYLRSPLWLPCPGQWHHVAISADYNNQEFTLWVDGRRLEQVPLNVTQVYGPESWIIGAGVANGNLQAFFSGRIDDVRLYNRVLKSTEIHALAADRPGGQPLPPDWMHAAPPSGRYIILQSENDGVPNNRPQKIAWDNQAPPWQRPWLLLVGFCLLFGFCWLSLRLWHRQQERLRRFELDKWKALETERGRIARDLHDDLGSGLSAISLLSEVARRRSDGSPVDEEIRQLASASHELSVRIREIIWMINARNDRLDYLVSYLTNYVVEKFDGSPVELNLQLPESPPDTLVGGEQRRALFLAVKEALRWLGAREGVRQLWFSFRLNGAFQVLLEWEGSAGQQAEIEHGPAFQQLIKNLREAGGGFYGAVGQRILWRFCLPV